MGQLNRDIPLMFSLYTMFLPFSTLSIILLEFELEILDFQILIQM